MRERDHLPPCRGREKKRGRRTSSSSEESPPPYLSLSLSLSSLSPPTRAVGGAERETMASLSAVGVEPTATTRRRWIHEAWTGCGGKDAARAEAALLQRFVKGPFTVSRVQIELQQLGLGKQYIATLEMNPDAPGPVIVWAHGAGAGLGFGFKNYDALANLGGTRRRVLAFDWLGQANSSRPCYPHGRWGRSRPDHWSAALQFFLDSFEAWRLALGVEVMDLFGHSTGAYVCTQYALAHPERVRRLILHGAAGIGSQPRPKGPDETRLLSGALPAVLRMLWEGGALNFGALQKLGRVAKEPTRRRFHRFQRARRDNVEDDEELDLLFEYFWTLLCAQPTSSDKWVNSFLVSLFSRLLNNLAFTRTHPCYRI